MQKSIQSIQNEDGINVKIIVKFNNFENHLRNQQLATNEFLRWHPKWNSICISLDYLMMFIFFLLAFENFIGNLVSIILHVYLVKCKGSISRYMLSIDSYKRPQSNDDADCVSLHPSGSCRKNILHTWHWCILQKGMRKKWLDGKIGLCFGQCWDKNPNLISMILVLVNINIAVGNFSWKIIH